MRVYHHIESSLQYHCWLLLISGTWIVWTLDWRTQECQQWSRSWCPLESRLSLVSGACLVPAGGCEWSRSAAGRFAPASRSYPLEESPPSPRVPAAPLPLSPAGRWSWFPLWCWSWWVCSSRPAWSLCTLPPTERWSYVWTVRLFNNNCKTVGTKYFELKCLWI